MIFGSLCRTGLKQIVFRKVNISDWLFNQTAVFSQMQPEELEIYIDNVCNYTQSEPSTNISSFMAAGNWGDIDNDSSTTGYADPSICSSSR